MTIKHGHHPADADRHGSDTWRHFHEGRAERVLIASPDLRVLFERSSDSYDPIGLARQYMQGADIVLTEGYKSSALPKIEVFRRAASILNFRQTSQIEVGKSYRGFWDQMWAHECSSNPSKRQRVGV
jgi:molybdopterin-guanine dinucleotide biosynthesis protein MobB